jgi:hypothetical protein
MSVHRTAEQIRQEIQAVEAGKLTCAVTDEDKRLYDARILELKRELRALDDTPVAPYRPASTPPGHPRGRRRG